jgi:hypothetical protein
MSVFLRFADLKARGVVGNWMTLKRWIDRENFPPRYQAWPEHKSLG